MPWFHVIQQTERVGIVIGLDNGDSGCFMIDDNGGGEIEALRGFDFATKKGGNETDAKLADPIAGAVTMADVMELQQLLNVSMASR
ncbi:unnamed protein product [Cladocopium goreaui]|uniref:Uncharacterized protein n=1 Tax=Cladocopium goreaui TaxID=2562237 RepID=A0A9P1CA63_9DINO|nr:unnamed protein product [Cladocopium goreaui]